MSAPPPTTPYSHSSSLRLTTHTPVNPLRAHLHSPSSALHTHHSEDPLIFEFGARVLRAGYTSEPHPRCTLEWTREEFWKREGDLWGSGGWYTGSRNRVGELWGVNVGDGDIGVVEDVVERGVRVAYNKYLLLDSKTRRIVLVVPTFFPVRLLTAVAKSLFVHFQMPAIMLVEAAVMAAIAAGTRSALVVDLGWHECVVDVVFELRIVGVGGRSRRGGKTLRGMWREMVEGQGAKGVADAELEDVLARVGWCRGFGAGEEGEEGEEGSGHYGGGSPSSIKVPLSTTSPPITLNMPFDKLSTPAEKTFFARTTVESPSPDYPDDDDTPLQELIYNVLRNAPIDVRGAVMQRIIIVGGASQIPGLKKRIIDEVRDTVRRRGWDRAGKRPPAKKEQQHKELKPHQDETYQWRREATASPEGNKKRAERGGKVRGVESLGSWVGAGLIAGMKVRGSVEVEREKFLAAVVAGGSGFPSDI